MNKEIIYREMDKCKDILGYGNLRNIERNSVEAYHKSLIKELDEWNQKR